MDKETLLSALWGRVEWHYQREAHWDEVEVKELRRDCAALAKVAGVPPMPWNDLVKILRELRPERVYEDDKEK